MPAPITTQLETGGLLLATIDMQDRTMNVFSFELMDALDQLMDRVETDDQVRCVVLTSGKASFLAGADLVMVRGFCREARTATHERMFDTCGRLGRQFVRLENCPKPWVAAVNGLALGGGLELALACRARVVADDKRVQLGLPEIRWGLLPGAGGTQRLPRLVGLDQGLDLLLSGRSLAPQAAVDMGLFHSAVAAPNLLDHARTVARGLVGRAYTPASKFPCLAPSGVPAHTAETARALAGQHGVSPETFDRYPAYSAIVDSVLKGAGLDLAEATAVEMNQFLRLMFNPVAGRMVRTLFLERLRAERELAAPDTVALTALRLGPITSARQAWADAFARLKWPQTQDPDLPPDTAVLVDAQGQHHRVALQVLADSPSHAAAATAVLAPAGPYGRVLEVLGGSPAEQQAVAALAARLWALAWPSGGQSSVLQTLRDRPLVEQVGVATRWAHTHPTGDAAFLDVAACLAGVVPGWTGGPLAWALDNPDQVQPFWDAPTRAAWDAQATRLAEACA